MNGIKLESDDMMQPLGGATPSASLTCCLIDNGQRCMRPTGNASYSKRIAKTVQQRRLKLVLDQSARHIYICDEHKNTIQHLRNQQKNRDSLRTACDPSDKAAAVHCEINFFLLPVNLLRRYKRHFKLPTRPGTNKAQLAEIVGRHFVKLPVNEKEVLTYFLYMCKNSNKTSRLDTSGAASAGGGAESSN